MIKKWIIGNGLFAIALFLGFYCKISLAVTISIITGWYVIVATFLLLIKPVRETTFSKLKGPLFNGYIDFIFNCYVLEIFFFNGYLYLSGFYLIHIFILMYYRCEYKKYLKRIKY